MGIKVENKNKLVVCVAIFVLICLPLALNEIMMFQRVREYVGEGKDWLGFWGGYLGAAVSAAVAFVVLKQQLEQNHTENENNRKSQQRNVSYQHEKQRLDDFKKLGAEYSTVITLEEILLLVDRIVPDTYGVNQDCVKLRHNVIKLEILISLYLSDDNPLSILANQLMQGYVTIMIDIQNICSAIIIIKEKKYNVSAVEYITNSDYLRCKMSNEFIGMIEAEDPENLTNEYITELLLTRYIRRHQIAGGNFINEFRSFVQSEEARINAILTKDL